VSCQTSLPLPQTLAAEMTLFELDESLCLLMESATEMADNAGEISDELRQALLDYCEAFGTKVDNIANYIKSQENEARNAKAEIERLQARQATADKKVDRLKVLVKYFMQSRNLRAMKGRLNTISLRKNSQDSLIVERPDTIPSEYWRVSITIGLPEWEELLSYLPAQHPLQVPLTADGNEIVRRDPDNAKLRSALASGRQIPRCRASSGPARQIDMRKLPGRLCYAAVREEPCGPDRRTRPVVGLLGFRGCLLTTPTVRPSRCPRVLQVTDPTRGRRGSVACS